MVVFSYLATTALWGSVTTAIGATAAGVIISLGQGMAWSLTAQALARRKVDGQTVKATISQTDQPRIRAYGRNLLGGVRAFYEADEGRLNQLVVCHHGPVDGLIQFWRDGSPVTTDGHGPQVDGGGRVTGERYLAVFFRDGRGAGGDYRGAFDPSVPGLARNWKDLHQQFPALWTPQHALQNQATFYTVFGDPSDESFAKEFPRGPNTSVQVEVRGSRVRDLAGAEIYSENAALCIRDLLTHADGWAFGLSKLDAASWTNFTAICAQAVNLKNGGTEPRYRLCGFYALDESLKDVTARMLSVCDGQLYETADGKIGVLGGAWSVPDVTITGDDILSFNLRDGYEPLETYNILKGSFVSPNHAYQPIEVREIEDTAALVAEEPRTEQLDLDMCPSGTQLQRLMKIKMAKDRRAQVGTIRTNLVGMKARWPKGDGLHTIRLDAPEFGLSGIYEVTSHVFSVPDGFCEIGIASISNPYGWNPATEETDLPLNYSSIPTPNNAVGNPSGVSLFQERVLVSSGVYGVQLTVVVAPPGRGDLKLRAEVSPGLISDVTDNDAGEWVQMSGGRLRASSGILDDQTTYTVRIKWEGRTDWVSAGSITVTANADQPSPPSSFSAIATGTDVALDWRNASSRFYRTQIWRASSSNIGAATLVATVSGVAGQVSDYTDTPGLTGTLYYWARTINGSGVQSDPAGPVSVTL